MKGAIEFLVPSYLILLLVIFILPFYSVESYSILKNTTSHLGAQHAPIVASVAFDAKEDRMHSLFSSLTGASFTVFAMSAAFMLRHRTAKISALLVGVLAVLLSVLIFTVPEFRGIWQRTLFIVAFGWLIVLFSGQEKGKPIPKYRYKN